jgi:uncharacterized protein
MKFLRRVFVFVTLAYLGICAYMFVAQRKMQYRPDPSTMNPASASLPQAMQEALTTRDGEMIVTWWIAPRDDKLPVFLYLHGNGGNLQSRAERFARLTQSGTGLLGVSWRGYGGSSGTPTEAGLRNDARAAYDNLIGEKRVAANRIIVFGESLGTTVATILASEVPVAALALDSSFDSAWDVASRAYPWLPVRWLLLDQFRADLAAPNVKAPVQQFHCRNDPVTPLASASMLQARFPDARNIHIVEGACHVASFAQYEKAFDAFVKSAVVLSR